MKRYNHWFWNSKILNKVAQNLSYLNSFIWHKMYGRK